MWSKLCKNSILQGTVDFYCLACEFLLRSEDDANAHIVKPIHKKNIEKAPYVASCPEDHIRKVNKGYYCEHCNVYLTTMTKVTLHRADDEHIFNKSDGSERTSKPSFLKWVRNAVIAFDDLLIDEGTWNGFVEDTCVVCDMEYDDKSIHKSGTQHILKIIQSKVQIGGDNSLSRKIDDSTYQCLTCNSIVLASALPTHFDTQEHKKKYLECRKLRRAFKQTSDENVDPNMSQVKNQCQPSKSSTKNANPETKEVKTGAIAKVSKTESKPQEASTKDDNKKPQTSKENESQKKKKKEIPKEFTANIDKVLGTKHFIKVEGESAFCFLCEWKISGESAATHVNHEHHLTLERMHRNRNKAMKKEFEYKENKKGANSEAKATDKPAAKSVEKCTDKSVEKPTDKTVEKPTDKTVEKPTDKTVEKATDKTVEKATDKTVEKAADKTVEKASDKTVEKPTDKTVEKATDKSDKKRTDQSVPETTKKEAKKTEPKSTGNEKAKVFDAEANKTKILDSIKSFLKNQVLIDLISDKAFCKKCSLTINYVFEDIETHIKEHNEKKDVAEKYPKYIDDTLMKAWSESVCKKVEEKVAEEVAPEEVAPEDLALDEVAPEEEAPEEVAPEEVAPEEVVAPKEVASEDLALDEVAPEEVAPEEIEETPSVDEDITETATAIVETKKPEKAPKKQKEQKCDEEIEDPANYALENNLTYNKDFNKAFCRICDTKVPASLKSMKEHVNGNLHKSKCSNNQPSVADMRPASPQYRTQRMEDFADTVVVHRSNWKETAVVNEKFAISLLSLLMVTRNDVNRFRCHVCEKGLSAGEVEEHGQSRKHARAMESAPVVLGLDDEFVREVRPGVFHCGFCNQLEAGWGALRRHLAGAAHARDKMTASWCLEELLPAVREHFRERMQLAVLMRMLMGNIDFF